MADFLFIAILQNILFRVNNKKSFMFSKIVYKNLLIILKYL